MPHTPVLAPAVPSYPPTAAPCRYASTYQMLRGTLVLFAGMFTILILRRQLFVHNWLGMVLITAGAALVGASSIIYNSSSSTQQPGHQDMTAVGLITAAAATSHNGWYGISRVASRGLLTAAPEAAGGEAAGGTGGVLGLGLLPGLVMGSSSGGGDGDGGVVAAAPLFGDILVVAAQMFTALQFILEEKFLVKYKVMPLAVLLLSDVLVMSESSTCGSPCGAAGLAASLWWGGLHLVCG